MPNTTPQQVSFILEAAGSCNSTTIQSVKDSLTALMSDPATMYGVYIPDMVVDVECTDTGAFQVGVGVTTTMVTLSCYALKGNTPCHTSCKDNLYLTALSPSWSPATSRPGLGLARGGMMADVECMHACMYS